MSELINPANRSTRRSTQEYESIRIHDRWFKIAGVVFAIVSSAWIVGKWAWSRVGQEELEEVRIESKQSLKDTTGRIEVKLEKQQEVIGNIHDNLIILMDRGRVRSKPLRENEKENENE